MHYESLHQDSRENPRCGTGGEVQALDRSSCYGVLCTQSPRTSGHLMREVYTGQDPFSSAARKLAAVTREPLFPSAISVGEIRAPRTLGVNGGTPQRAPSALRGAESVTPPRPRPQPHTYTKPQATMRFGHHPSVGEGVSQTSRSHRVWGGGAQRFPTNRIHCSRGVCVLSVQCPCREICENRRRNKAVVSYCETATDTHASGSWYCKYEFMKKQPPRLETKFSSLTG